MAAFTTTQAGVWHTGSTWVGGVAPSASSDTVTIDTGHTVTLNAPATVAGITAMNGPLILNSTLTLAGDALQGDASLTINAGGKLLFDTTAADRKWLYGTVSGQTNCKIIMRGNSGSWADIDKTGSNECWFDVSDENAGGIAESGAWDCEYGRIQHIGKADGSFAVGISSFGAIDLYFLHCLIKDNDAPLMYPRPYQWNGTGNRDFKLEDTKLEWTGNNTQFRFVTGGAGTGAVTFKRNVVSGPEGVGSNGCIWISTLAPLEDCYFDNMPNLNGHGPISPGTVIRFSSGFQTLIPSGDLTDIYFLMDQVDPADREQGVVGVGNPHWVQTAVPFIADGCVLDYCPPVVLIDGGDGFFGLFGGTSEIKNCINLAVPCGTGTGSLVSVYSNIDDWEDVKVHHNTVLGRGAQLVFMEIGFTVTVISELKSNLVVDIAPNPAMPYGARGAHLMIDINDDTNPADLIDPAGITYNYVQNPEEYTDPVTPFLDHDGYCGKMTGSLNATNRMGTDSPEFVDDTRCFLRWCIHMGADGSGEPSLSLPMPTAPEITDYNIWRRPILDYGRALLMADPLLGQNLLDWVRAGLAPTADFLDPSVTDQHGHEGIGYTVGAVAWGEGGGEGFDTGNIVTMGFGAGAIKYVALAGFTTGAVIPVNAHLATLGFGATAGDRLTLLGFDANPGVGAGAASSMATLGVG